MFSDIFLFAVFSIVVIIFEMISHDVLTMDMIQGILSGNTSIYIILAIAIFLSRKYLMGMQDKNNNLERTLLTLSNELQRIRTEAEWRNDASSQAGSNRFSSTSHVFMGQCSEYTDEYETYWVEFTALFNNRRKKEGRSPTQLYNILSIETGLSASTLASFYRHQKSPRTTSMDKIIAWVEKEGNKKVVSFSDSSSSSSNRSNNGTIFNGGSSAK
ncbi:uncharacterized protein OCT59_027368 [Rhizophagus irregularis]|uniref:Uncharacterized protein n=1 Tax=Rhizophagus irregularis (strain DAOM 181602 / DAOM 197198 / MUCL 43194) TaxID=747089 RepID=A0A2P4Q6W9_RHIID|nr:hypothetical protein GLOIN_2v1587402 [Rhizophagus irregularis DAOM 181602=DAOM 197198]POG73387.1 hypothetical protein GLOIN_2v1587402 [Rhizophagus irregularis DAOM 181602=DAOM 197198]UZO07065.1 hypothetical protein OCT59_027368 [Rhizophagus irregularis]|eukprot:XP_025180253.1 hypothetical protein GLOIN_2v1587402 [Rhizophagus irregularis DAOM 181602=DAOM 197198]